MAELNPVIDRACGIQGCETDWLSSQRHESDLDVMEFTRFAMHKGWGDGLPLVPPTEERVVEFLAKGGRFPDELVAVLPPMRTECTVEKVAVNAVMAGAPPESLELICAAIAAMAEPEFDLAGLNATTGSVVPTVFVNGPVRNALDIPYQAGCFGGQAGPAPAIGRAIRLVMRNVAGQLIGVTSQSVFGQPGRVAGIVVGEWEERSPWAPLAERRGVPGDAVTVYGAMGTTNICDIVANTGPQFLDAIGKSLAYQGANGFLTSSDFSETFVAINPVWADAIARDVPRIEDVQELIWQSAAIHVDNWAKQYIPSLEAAGRIRANGKVHLTQTPEDVLVMMCGGTGSLHAMALHSWGTCRTVTRKIGA